jgi:hypothetical protein
VIPVVDTAVEVCLVALVVAHPDDDRDADDLPLERRAARGLVAALDDVSHAIRRYRHMSGAWSDRRAVRGRAHRRSPSRR